MTRPIRTRFAPSPTGYMHIGGMRTALFNWLFARRHQGTFILRIDDTDQARNQESALGPILQAFRWLELTWEEGPEVGGSVGPYFQSERNELYSQACQQLLDERKAFHDFTSPTQAKAEREQAEKEKRNYFNNRSDLDFSEAEVRAKISNGEPYVIRFLVPREQNEPIVVNDLIRGRVEFQPGLMPDPVIMRGDGSPLYNFATVIDDALMQISHVIRAEEHLSNTPVQVLINQALGYQLPEFAHIPYVAAPGTKEKLSKRKLAQYRKNPQFKKLFDQGDLLFGILGIAEQAGLDPVMMEYYERIGYLPEAILNALARIGWSLDDQTEILSRETIIANFSLERVVKSAAGFDPDKLLSLQSHWMGEKSLLEKESQCRPFLQQAGFISQAEAYDLKPLISAVGDRLVVAADLLRYDEFFCADDALPYDEKAFQKRIVNTPGTTELLEKLLVCLRTAELVTSQEFDSFVHQFVERAGIEMGQIIHALRIAVTGKSSGVGLFDAMALIGNSGCVRRMETTIQRAKNSDSPTG